MTTVQQVHDMVHKDGNTLIGEDEVTNYLATDARVYAYWHDQIVKIHSEHYLDKYKDEALAYWVSTLTIENFVKRTVRKASTEEKYHEDQ